MKTELTIGIPVHNEENNIGNLLNKILSIKIPSKQILVVSSGSTDKTNEIVKSFPKVDLIMEDSRKGKVSAINIIIQNSSSDKIILIDGDVVIDDNTIQIIYKKLNEKDILACTAQVKPLMNNNSFLSKLSFISCLAWHRLRVQAQNEGAFIYPTGYLLAVNKNVIEECYLESKVINDDAMIGLLLFEKGVTFYYCSDAVVYIVPPLTIKDFFIQKVRTRLGRRQLASDNPIMSRIEKDWRRNVIKQNSIFAFILLIFDFLTRMIAKAKLFYNKNGNYHLWKKIKRIKKESQ